MSEKINYRQILLQAGIEMQKRDLTVETWGNISLRDTETGKIYLTPSGMPYDTLAGRRCLCSGQRRQCHGRHKQAKC
jgi:ribulose-5-phosphate 4-epimerase/fuculose-1-phosphate aldolase